MASVGPCGLAPRMIDHRISLVLEAIKCHPERHMSAVGRAAMVHLSVSRFLHLFKCEIGTYVDGASAVAV